MPTELKVGCCGFPVSRARYSKTFSVVEVQQTFYQPPSSGTLEKWRSQVPAEFEFTMKAWQVITHESNCLTYRRLREPLSSRQKEEAGNFRVNSTVIEAWKRTLECARILGSRRILFQCPARFAPTPENKSNLCEFFRTIGRRTCSPGLGQPLIFIWEPRGVWKPNEIRELCDELNLIHGVDPFLQPPVTGGIGYFRLHGGKDYRHRYTDADLKELQRRVEGYKPCYVLFNNIGMVEDALRFKRLLSESY
ncbi:MAG TPA: DUF72 domain-containing protein [Terriglobia bacterium]|nr:DUF72 domain-containing protein [Terriglobia bacterium]